ncbi:high-temperature-induced dauer-formation protein-domain-containing protein [Fomitopsis serialis]|uniref:high-temperature-induced dauer-formation protein-domain-containing protein n=1 Tax=Fomitopsis serialis TaxID=139415 RepID=UPI0020076B3D|nr:high-temperature-induced dauer-formation protein-domain-containing protein [Neoantrodia serialis]KAH9934896.1 high-temperature-induced dauer-formation protein-domain-containing protein [Neoantrodia serialis]
MLASLPQKITVPFNLLGDEAKLAFRSQPGGIAKLATTRHILETDSYWDQYVTLFDSASDVFTLISHNDVRRALYDAPENVAMLIRVITSRLFNLVSDHTFPSAPNTSMTTFATSFMKAASPRNTTKEALNCVRVLQRVLPVIFELESETSRLEMEVFWKREEVTAQSVVSSSHSDPQFVIDDEEDEDGEGQVGSSTKGRTKETKQRQETLQLCIDLMFCCGFTLPTKLQVDHYKISYVIWEKGVGSTVEPGPSQLYESNRTEVLRLLLVLLSKQIYTPPAALFTCPSLYSLQFVQKTPRRHVLSVLCSLMNTAMHSPQAGVANFVGSVAGKLPYNHLVFKGDDPHTALIGTCLQTLCALLDFQSGTAKDAVADSEGGSSHAPTSKTNAFRYFVAKLHRSNDFAFIFQGIVAIFEQQMATMNNLLPGSRKSIPYIAESIIFFWKMIDLNKKFRAYVLDSDKATDILAYLLCYGIEIKDKPQQHGFCRTISYIVQSISAERIFGQKLASPVKTQLPQKWSNLGTAADFMIHAIYSMVATTSGALTSLYPALIIALSNSAPYFKHLSVTASTRLIQLFTAFSNPSFLLADEGHPRLLFFMLETFNSVLLRNLSDNPNLVYGILHAHKAFEGLGTFTLARGLREIRRIQQAKEERARAGEANADKGKGRANDQDEEQPHEEKARLLRNESNADYPTNADSAANTRSNSEDDAVTAMPLMSPTLSEHPLSGRATERSEKARGKMRAGMALSLEMTGSLESLAASTVGRNGFVPTQEWVTSWQQGLPLDIIMLVVSELLPKIQELQSSLNPANANGAVVDLIKSTNLEHILPKPGPLSARRFVWSDASIIWLTSLIWGEVYVRGMSPLGIWNSTNVRLFLVKHAEAQSRPITEAVTNAVGGLLNRTQSSQSIANRPRPS